VQKVTEQHISTFIYKNVKYLCSVLPKWARDVNPNWLNRWSLRRASKVCDLGEGEALLNSEELKFSHCIAQHIVWQYINRTIDQHLLKHSEFDRGHVMSVIYQSVESHLPSSSILLMMMANNIQQYNSWRNSHTTYIVLYWMIIIKIHFSQRISNCLFYGWQAGQREVNYKWWSDLGHVGQLGMYAESMIG